MAKTITTSIRIDPDLLDRARRAANRVGFPPPPTVSEIISRGIVLALQELEHADAVASRPAKRK